jgi:hypothetical protein
MRNVWKGLSVGALTGAVVGIAMDWAASAGQSARELSEAGSRAIREHGPDAAAAVRETARDLAHRASESTAAARERLIHAND